MEKLCYEAIDDGVFFGILRLGCSILEFRLNCGDQFASFVKSGTTARQVLRWVCLF